MTKQLQDNDLKLLRIFDTVANCGGFSAAQAELNISQSAISNYMAQLEARLGLRLCNRGNAGFSLTQDGETILEEMKPLFQALNTFQTRANDCRSSIRGEISIGLIDAIPTHGSPHIIDMLREFSQTNHEALIHLEILNAKDLEERTIKGDIDVSFGYFYHHVDTLTYRDVQSETLSLYCGQGSELFDLAEEEITIKTLEHHPYVDTKYYDSAFLKHDLPVQNRASSMHMEGVAMLVLTGQYLGFLPEHYASQWVARGEMRPILRQTQSRTALLQMATRIGSHHSRLLEEFLKVTNTILKNTEII